jgi:hypothetical protein
MAQNARAIHLRGAHAAAGRHELAGRALLEAGRLKGAEFLKGLRGLLTATPKHCQRREDETVHVTSPG